MKFKQLIVSTFFMASSMVCAQTQTPPIDIDFSALAENIKQTKALSGLPSGTAIAVIKGDKIIYQGNFGYANIAKQIKVTDKTPFYIASATKPFFALNTLIDVNAKDFKQSLSLAQMFPSLDIADIDEHQVTLKHLLTHTSTINNIPLVFATAFSGVHDKQSLKQLVLNGSVKTEKKLGEFNYTNVGYNIFSVFADEYFHMPWQQRLQQQLFTPLKMSLTSAQMSTFTAKHVAVAKPYSLMVPTQPDALYLEKVDQTMHAAGGMVSTANDLARFLIAQLNEGVVEQQQVFPAEIIKQSQQKQVTTDAKYLDFKRDGYAWGWYTGNYKGQRMLHHFGGFDGAHAHMSFIPEQKIGLVVLNNEDFLSARMTSIIADFVYGSLLQDADTKQRVDQRFSALNQKLANIDQMLASQAKKIAARKMNLSLPMSAYQGVYSHPLLGKIRVNVEATGQLHLRWGVLDTTASGFGKVDQIRVTFMPTSGEVIKFEATDSVKNLTYNGMMFAKLNNEL